MQHYTSHQLEETSITEWVPLFIIILIALVYLYALLCLNNKRNGLDTRRAISFLCGMSLLGVAMWPSLAQWAHSDLQGHMVQHLLIGMYAPILLVLGAPITLVLKVSSVNVARSITAVLKNRVVQIISHPVTAMVLNMGGMYLLYLTPLYNESLTKPYLHYLIHLHFLAAGFLFTWSIIGVDPTPKRPGFNVRVFALFISIASHAFLSKLMYAYLFPLNSPHSEEQIRAAAKLMYYWGDLAELILTIAVFTLWYQTRGTFKYYFTTVSPGTEKTITKK